MAVAEINGELSVRCGASFLKLDPGCSRGVGQLDEGFWQAPLSSRRGFLLFSLVSLLTRYGLCGLHASGVVHGQAVYLVVGSSGSGKTTLSLALVQAGWPYLSDDELLLRQVSGHVEALALRRGFYCTPQTMAFFPALTRAPKVPLDVDDKKVLDLESLYPGQQADKGVPRVLLFPRVAGGRRSRLVALDDTRAMVTLMRQSTPMRGSHARVTRQLALLTQLVEQSCSYRILLGEDVYREPEAVSELLKSLGHN